MANKKQRARLLKEEAENRIFAKSLEGFTNEEFEQYTILSELGVDEANEEEWAEYEALEQKRVSNITRD